MQLADLLNEYYAAEFDESWELERTANTLTGVAVRLHATGAFASRDTSNSSLDRRRTVSSSNLVVGTSTS